MPPAPQTEDGARPTTTVVAPLVPTGDVGSSSTTVVVVTPPTTTKPLSSTSYTATPTFPPVQMLSITQSTHSSSTSLITNPMSTSASTVTTKSHNTSLSLVATVGALGALFLVLSGIFLVFVVVPRLRKSRAERARATSWIVVSDYDDDGRQGGHCGAGRTDGGMMREVEGGFTGVQHGNSSGPTYGSLPSIDPDSITGYDDMSQSRSEEHIDMAPSSAVSMSPPSTARRDSASSRRSLAPWSVEQTKRTITGFLQPRSRNTKPQPSSPSDSAETQATLYDGVTPSPYQKEYLQYEFPGVSTAAPLDAADPDRLRDVGVLEATVSETTTFSPTSPDQEVISQITALLSSSINHPSETSDHLPAPLEQYHAGKVEPVSTASEGDFDDDSNPPDVPPKEHPYSPPTPSLPALTRVASSSAKHETVRTPHYPYTPTAISASATASPISATATLEMAKGWFRPMLRKKSSTDEKASTRYQPWEVDPSPTSPLLQFLPEETEAIQTDEPQSIEDSAYYTSLSPLRRSESNGPLSPPFPSLVHPTFSIHAIRKLPPVSVSAIPSFPDPQFTSQLMGKKAPFDYLPDSLIIGDGKRLSTIAEGGSVSDRMSVRTKSTSYDRSMASQDHAFTMSPQAQYNGFTLWDNSLPSGTRIEETFVSGAAQGGAPQEVSLFMMVRKRMEEPDRPRPKGPLPLTGQRRISTTEIASGSSGSAGPSTA